MNRTAQLPLPLFRDYPRLKDALPHIALGIFPTPVERLPSLGTGVDRLYIKRDDLSGSVYGGNKVRKLEFLLADAQRGGAREVMTVGFAGSNHALATTIYAHQMGMACTALLLPQLNARYVRDNLLASFSCGASLRHYRTPTLLGGGILACMLRGCLRHRVFPKLIPAGGSCPMGVAGYVNAALELRDQIVAGALPMPDRIYVPLGSMGTSVGLALGLQAAGMKTHVIAVRVIEEHLVSSGKVRDLFNATCKLLRRYDPTFPEISYSPDALTIRNEFMGDRYARLTESGAHATELMQEKAGIPLNGAYSAKAVAALLADAKRGDLEGKIILFWNTYNSRDLDRFTKGQDYRRLPQAFHRYFEEDVQPLDRPAIRY